MLLASYYLILQESDYIYLMASREKDLILKFLYDNMSFWLFYDILCPALRGVYAKMYFFLKNALRINMIVCGRMAFGRWALGQAVTQTTAVAVIKKHPAYRTNKTK